MQELLKALHTFTPACEQEERDQALILKMAALWPESILTRENEIAHVTSSGFILSEDGKKTLLVHHNIYHSWSWTGGHADGEPDLLAVALREAVEETGVQGLRPLSGQIVSLDILPVWGHEKNGRYVSSHLHLSAAYALCAPEGPVRGAPAENSGAAWFDLAQLETVCREPEMTPIYRKIIGRALPLIGMANAFCGHCNF